MKKNNEIQVVRKQFPVGLFSGGLVVALLCGAIQAQGQTVTFNFEDNTDDGFGHKFSSDASEVFPIVNIGGSLRMEVLRNGDFQEADHGQGGPSAFLDAMNAGVLAPAAYVISYDWYIDTSLSPGNYGTFLQVGTYINAGTGDYAQNFGPVKEVELNSAQLASGSVFSGTVSQTFTAKYGVLAATWTIPPQTFMRLGFILNGDGTQAKVYFDNVSVSPVPEPSTIALAGLGIVGLFAVRRFRKN